MRSKLFVPGARPELFEKALASEADALSFDLEDSVIEGRKAEARSALRQFLRKGSTAASGKTMIVRVNPASSPHFAPDILAAVQQGVHIINLPKPRDAAEVRAAAKAIAQAQAANRVGGTVGLLVNVETPTALRIAHELAAADARVVGLQLGLDDLFEPLGISRRDESAVRQAMFTLRIAAGEAHVFAYDSAFADIEDEAGFTTEARQARSFGFIGKSCIHPSQVALANAAFRPSEEEVAHALRVVQAASAAETQGIGAWVIDGRMIDAPFLRRAEQVVAIARRLGMAGTAP